MGVLEFRILANGGRRPRRHPATPGRLIDWQDAGRTDKPVRPSGLAPDGAGRRVRRSTIGDTRGQGPLRLGRTRAGGARVARAEQRRTRAGPGCGRYSPQDARQDGSHPLVAGRLHRVDRRPRCHDAALQPASARAPSISPRRSWTSSGSSEKASRLRKPKSCSTGRRSSTSSSRGSRPRTRCASAGTSP